MFVAMLPLPFAVYNKHFIFLPDIPVKYGLHQYWLFHAFSGVLSSIVWEPRLLRVRYAKISRHINTGADVPLVPIKTCRCTAHWMASLRIFSKWSVILVGSPAGHKPLVHGDLECKQ